MYIERTYRQELTGKDLVSFEVKLNQSDLFILAERALSEQAHNSLAAHRRLVEEYIKRHPEFATTLKPYSAKEKPSAIIREMIEASAAADVGPMATVAGAVAEYVGRDLLQYSSQVIIENGGDIFIKINQLKKVGIFAGVSRYSGKLALEVRPEETPLGICTSSGTVGPSLSFGHADAAVAVCNSAILADAWATRLGNMLKSPADLKQALRFVKSKPEIKGVVLIIADKIGACGDIKLIQSS
ncbi:MAG: UPF0280 family protein [Candidatus Omnitrophica bacterium]|nr:UPF0280 family protein [Candidatus Omnitrophota bacterium]